MWCKRVFEGPLAASSRRLTLSVVKRRLVAGTPCSHGWADARLARILNATVFLAAPVALTVMR